MVEPSDTSSRIGTNPLRKWGFWAIAVGGLALVLVFVQIVGPTLEPSPPAGTQIGEIAGEIKRSAWRTFLGLPKPEAEVQEVRPAAIWSYLALTAPILGVIAVVLSAISGITREGRGYAAYGATLGATAIVFQYFWWVALLFAGVMLLVAIIQHIGDIFSP